MQQNMVQNIHHTHRPCNPALLIDISYCALYILSMNGISWHIINVCTWPHLICVELRKTLDSHLRHCEPNDIGRMAFHMCTHTEHTHTCTHTRTHTSAHQTVHTKYTQLHTTHMTSGLDHHHNLDSKNTRQVILNYETMTY